METDGETEAKKQCLKLSQLCCAFKQCERSDLHALFDLPTSVLQPYQGGHSCDMRGNSEHHQ